MGVLSLHVCSRYIGVGDGGEGSYSFRWLDVIEVKLFAPRAIVVVIEWWVRVLSY